MEMLINVKELNEVCALPDRKYSTETHFSLANRVMVHEVFRYQKFQDDFADNIRYVYNTNDNSFIGTFKPSYDEFLRTIIKTLNLKSKKGFTDNEELTKLLLERVNLLSGIQDRKELRGEFPEINNLLTEAQEYWKEIEEHQSNPIYKEEYSREGDGQEHYFFQCGLRAKGIRKGFDGLTATQAKVYERFVNRREQYKKLVEDYSYDNFIKENYDINKLAMYMAHKYLTICEQSPDSIRVIKRYTKLLEKYIIESAFSKDVYIKVNGVYINYDNIITRFNEQLRRMENMVAKVNWVIVPEGKLDKYVKKGLDPQKSYIMSDEEIENMRRAKQDKVDFYGKNEPLLKVYGVEEFKGYIAYIYKNGEVLLDTITAKGNAIYHIPARYFEMVSGLDKQKLMKHPAAKRIIHAGNWQSRAQKVIDTEGTLEEQKQAQELVNRIIEDNEKRTR